MKEKVTNVLKQDMSKLKRDLPAKQSQLLVEAKRMKKQEMKSEFVD